MQKLAGELQRGIVLMDLYKSATGSVAFTRDNPARPHLAASCSSCPATIRRSLSCAPVHAFTCARARRGDPAREIRLAGVGGASLSV